MFIDELNYDQCWDIWDKINRHPVKVARALFPNRPPKYVALTKLIGAYAANRGTALSPDLAGLAGEDKRDRQKVYIKIASELWCQIPAWANAIKLENL